ncbi:DUF1758 domain-containing protein [Trichonephila clavata]|uniref:DUF1758 domain-containing protein n=1 Tax=Trichonephila clavata TaxID=2740835 RepID=A0A8X6LTL7_TRICU|nr:DUF1758 domain-containing protein [Trichonephila clavata]
MYRQILVDREDQNLQLIVWRESKDSPIREYKLCTVTFGTASASYLATRCLFQVGLELERDNPTVSSLIKESFYIDDLMAGATSSEEAITSIKTLSQVLEARGFHLRKWRSNSPDVLSRISSNWVGNTSNLEIHPDECSKALGLTWNSVKDTFIFNLKLWLLKLDWDSPLPDALATKWKTFRKEFEQICSIHIPRWIHTVSQQVTLHGFCDASELAYASVIYAVQPQADANKPVANKSILSALCPFIDRDGLIRVGGRLRNSTPQYSAKHPIILPNQHEICNLIVNMYRATTSKQLMGDLPAHRVTPSRPFSACGVDYAGPINVLRYRGRGARTTKGYIALCVSTIRSFCPTKLVYGREFLAEVVES